MEVMDIDAGSFMDWLAQTENAGTPRSCSRCPMALFLDEIEGGEHLVSRDTRRRYVASLSRKSEPTPRLAPGEEKILPEWAQWFITEIDAEEDECLEPAPVTGVFAADVLEWALVEERRQASKSRGDH